MRLKSTLVVVQIGLLLMKKADFDADHRPLLMAGQLRRLYIQILATETAGSHAHAETSHSGNGTACV